MSQSTLPAAGHGTAVPAPDNFRAVVNPDNSIDTSWDEVPGDGITYTLKETESRDGVKGAVGITATHSHRTPHTMRTYEYWVVAVKDGAESADSNHATVSLPHGGGSNAETGRSPAEILHIGKGKQGGDWNLGIGPRKQDAKSVEDTFGNDCNRDHNGIVTVNEHGLSSAHPRYFTPTSDGTAVMFTSYMDGAVKPPSGTGGSAYPRTELRELDANGNTTTWDAGTGVHTLSGRTAVLALPRYKRQICVAQIHGTASPGRKSSDTLELRVEGKDGDAKDGFTWVVTLSDGNDGNSPEIARRTVKHDYALGDDVAWEIRVDDGAVTVTIDGTPQFDHALPVHDGSYPGQYFKTGCYCQTNVDPYKDHHGKNKAEDSASISLGDLRLHHPWSDHH
jgi:Alginate lyase